MTISLSDNIQHNTEDTRHLSDQEFIQLITNKELHDKLYRYALKLCHHEDNAKDLFQEVMLKIWEKRAKFDGGNFQAWTYTIMRNAFINHYRTATKKHGQHDHSIETRLMEHPDSINADAIINNVCARTSSWDTSIIMQQLERITTNQKEAIKLVMRGYGYEEIADILNKPLGTVKGHIFHGRERLYQLLIKDFGDIMPKRRI